MENLSSMDVGDEHLYNIYCSFSILIQTTIVVILYFFFYFYYRYNITMDFFILLFCVYIYFYLYNNYINIRAMKVLEIFFY